MSCTWRTNLAGGLLAFGATAAVARGIAAADADSASLRSGLSTPQPHDIEAPYGQTPRAPSDTLPPFATDGERPHWRRNLFVRFASDQAYLVTSWWPRESHRYGFSVPLAIAVIGAAGSGDSADSLDHRWQQSIQRWTSDGRHGVAEAFTRLGDSESALAILGGTYLVSRWSGHERLQRASSLSAEALLSTALYSSALKRISDRQRPAGDSPDSFPSGHSMGAFAVAAVFSGEYRDRPWVPWVAYGSAGLIGLSRIGLGRHFPSDVLAGAVLGQSMGAMVTHRNGGGGDGPSWGRLQPLVDEQGGGFGLAYRRSWPAD